MTKTYLIKTKVIPCTEASMTSTFNEVARKGYRFDDDSLTSFFNQAGAWYQPSDQQENVQLSPIEKLNIQLIRFMEKEKKNRRFRSD